MNSDPFEADLRVVVRAISPREAPPTLRDRLSTITEVPTTRAMWFSPMARWAVYAVIVATALGVAYLALARPEPSPAPSPSPTPAEEAVELSLERLKVDHPANWQFSPYRENFSGFSSLGYLTTGPFNPDAICRRTANSISCNFAGHPVEPGGVVVRFEHWGKPDPMTAFQGETEATVGRMPAYFSETEVDGVLTLTWRVRMPGVYANWYVIEGQMREPGADDSRRQVEDLIASLRFDPEPTILPTSGAEFDRLAGEAARQALEMLLDTPEAPGYACFAPEPGATRDAVVDTVPQQPQPSKPLEVTCATFVAADADLWHVRFLMSWSATDDLRAGRQQTEVWVATDGPGATMWSGDEPP